MTKRAWFLGILAGTVGLLVAGCGGTKSCEELCEAREACVDVIPSETSCKDQCVTREKIVKAAGCEASQATFDECVSELEDECTAAVDCSTPAKQNNGCINNYCDANPDACAGN